MPRPSKILTELKEDDKKWLDSELIRNNFSGYMALEEALAKRGYKISHASIHRYGAEFHAKTEKMAEQLAKTSAIAEKFKEHYSEETGIDINAISLKIASNSVMEALVDIDFNDGQTTPAQLVRMATELARAGVTISDYKRKIRKELDAAFVKIEEKNKQNKGITPELLDEIRTRIYRVHEIE